MTGVSLSTSDDTNPSLHEATVRRRTSILVGSIAVAGVTLVATLWLGVFALISSERETAIAHAYTETRNLSAAFADEVTRTLDAISGAMELVAEQMRASHGTFDIHEWARQIPLLSSQANQGAIIGPDGRLVSTTLDPHPKPIDLSDREHFRVHLDGTYKGLFISKPVVGRISRQITILVSRRVDAVDGRFLGVIVFSLPPSRLTTLHRLIDLGKYGRLALVGTDHVIRARFGADSPDGLAGAGTLLPSAAGANLGTGRPDVVESHVDHVVRLYTDRRVAGYPLFVGVGLAVSEFLAPARAHAWQIKFAATVVTLLLCGLFGALIAEIRQRSRNELQLAAERSALAADIALRKQTEEQLRESEQRFRDLADIGPEWVWETDTDHRITFLAHNQQSDPAYSVLRPESRLGHTLWELAGGDPERDEAWRQHKADLDGHRAFRGFRPAVRTSTGGVRHICINGKPVFDSTGNFRGFRGTSIDETRTIEALRRAERAETLLRDAMDSISEGLAIYDTEDRFVLCNEAYRRLYPASAPLMKPGVMFAKLVRNSIAAGIYPQAVGREEQWFDEVMRHHNEATGEVENELVSGQRIRLSDRRMRNGGTVAMRIDITELRRTQDALCDSERRMRDYASTSSDWFWEQDADLRYTWISEDSPSYKWVGTEYRGKRRDELILHDPTDEAWIAHLRQLEAHLPFRDFRYSTAVAEGTHCYVSVSGMPIFDATGNFAGYRGTGRDATGDVAAEEALRIAKVRAEQAEELLRDAVDSISEGFVIYDRDDRLVMCNASYRSLYPESAERMVPGIKFEELLRHGLAAREYPEAVGREEAWLTRRLREHANAIGEIEQQRGDGKWVLVSERRMRNGGIAGLRVNITALKQAEARLRESEMRLDRAQAIAGIGSWELDVAARRYIWSKELYRIRGVSPESFEPNIDNVEAYVHPDDYPAVRRWLAELVAGQKHGTREVRIVRPDGEVRLLRVEGQAVREADGIIRRLAGTMQDITQQRLVERQLAQAQKMEAIGTLTGGMAHDFNNGLGVIIGNLDLLGRLVKADQNASELCDEARQGALRCTDLVRRLLAFARRQPLHPVPTDVNTLVNDAGRLLSRTLGEHIALKLELDAALSLALADPAQLEAALINLATNARDAMPKGGKLHISTRNAQLDAMYAELHPDAIPGAYVLIEVSDTGTGIDPEIMGHIFEPFFTTKGQAQGTGLGLSMVFGFVKQSGGHMAVYSEKGHGATFRIYLPLAQVGDVQAPVPEDRRPVLGGNETVLVVEDNAPLRSVATQQLTALGFRVFEAEHAKAALQVMATEDRIDLLFTDVVMPGAMDGIELAREAVRLRPGLRVVLTSGFPGGRMSDHRLSNSEFPLVGKPYRLDELARAVRDALDKPVEHPADHAAPRAGRVIDEVTA